MDHKDKHTLSKISEYLFKEVSEGPCTLEASLSPSKVVSQGSNSSMSDSDSEIDLVQAQQAVNNQKIKLDQKKIEENNEDLITFSLVDGSKVYFHNIKINYFRRTYGFTELSLRTILKFILVFVDSNISSIVALVVIYL